VHVHATKLEKSALLPGTLGSHCALFAAATYAGSLCGSADSPKTEIFAKDMAA
jgi:hypothetical protein